MEFERKKEMKKLFCCLLILCQLLCITACDFTDDEGASTTAVGDTTTAAIDTRISIPNVYELDEATCKSLLASKGLIPKIKYDYSDYVDEGLVVYTEPEIGSLVDDGEIITVYLSKGKRYYELPHAVGYMMDVTGIDPFPWGDNGEEETKGFYTPYVQEGYLYIPMYLKCSSEYDLAFYGDFGTASINDTFDKSVPIEVIYSSKKVDNNSGMTEFSVKIPLSDLGVQKPTNVYIEFDFTVDTTRQTFKAGFNLTW